MKAMAWTPNFIEQDPSDYGTDWRGNVCILDEGVVHLVSFSDADIPFETGETRKYYRRCLDDLRNPVREGTVVLDASITCLACLAASPPQLHFTGTTAGRMSSRKRNL